MNEYRALNNIKVDVDSYKEVEVNDELILLKVKGKLNKTTKHKNPLKSAVIIVASLIMCCSTAYAGYYINNIVKVNDKTLPELDPMHVVKINDIDAKTDNETGFYIEKKYPSYEKLSDELGVSLLESNLAIETPYLRTKLWTSVDKSLCRIFVDNYIIGDTSNFRQLVDNKDIYDYDHGNKYYSPISLEVDIIPTEEELIDGSDMDYLGMYEFQESYISANGYKVNIIRGTENDSLSADSIISEKRAIFVADGIRYTLKGRVSTELLKEIVDSMN